MYFVVVLPTDDNNLLSIDKHFKTNPNYYKQINQALAYQLQFTKYCNCEYQFDSEA